MKRTKLSTVLIISGLLQAGTVYADVDQVIRDSLGKALPGVEVENIRATPISGLHEVQVGSSLFYVTDDGKHLIQGELIELETRTNLSKDRKKLIRLSAVDAMGDDQMIVFAASKPRHTVTVFTDIDCGYCRKLHNEIEQYNDKGITVRYLMFPRAGLNSSSYDKAVTVWCSKDQKVALTEAKSGEVLAKIKCDNPVAAHMKLGSQAGVSGTPAIMLPDGEMVPGYIPPARLAAMLDAGT